MKQPYEQGKRMNLLHGLYDEQMGQQVPGVYSYAEIGRMIGRSISAVKLADDEERLIAGRYRILPDPILEEWDKARFRILYLTGRIDIVEYEMVGRIVLRDKDTGKGYR